MYILSPFASLHSKPRRVQRLLSSVAERRLNMNGRLTMLFATSVLITGALAHVRISVENARLGQAAHASLQQLINRLPPQRREHVALQIMRAIGMGSILGAVIMVAGAIFLEAGRDPRDIVKDSAEEASPSLAADIDAELESAGLKVSANDIEQTLQDVVEDPPTLSQSEFTDVLEEIRQTNENLATKVDDVLESPLEAIASSLADKSGEPATQIEGAIKAEPSLLKEIEDQASLAVAAEREDVVLEELAERPLLPGVLSVIAIVAGAAGLLIVIISVLWSAFWPDSASLEARQTRKKGGSASRPEGLQPSSGLKDRSNS